MPTDLLPCPEVSRVPASGVTMETGRWAALVPLALRRHPHWPRLARWAPKLGEFFLAQGLQQLLMALSGFLLLRWMPVADYAVFTLAFAIQSAMIAFCDIGFTSAIVPLVGAHTGDRAKIGAYVAGARRLRRWLLPFVLAGGAVAFGVLGPRQHLDAGTIAGLFTLVAVTVCFNAVTVLHGAPLVIRQDLRYLHVTQNAMGALRLVGYLLGHAAGWLGSLFALGLNTALNGGLAGALRQRARTEFDEPAGDAPTAVAARREIIRFIRPQVPIMVFNAVEGQIVVLLSSLFGSGAALAATGALTRLNLVFSITPFFLGWIVEPYFARIDAALVPRRFWQIVLAGAAGLALAPLAGFLVPAPFLWLLGPNYHHLHFEVGLMLLAGAIGSTVALVSTLSLARRWVFADAILWIAPLTVGLQVLAITLGRVETPAGAIAVMIWGNTGSLIAYLVLARRGQRRRSPEAGR